VKSLSEDVRAVHALQREMRQDVSAVLSAQREISVTLDRMHGNDSAVAAVRREDGEEPNANEISVWDWHVAEEDVLLTAKSKRLQLPDCLGATDVHCPPPESRPRELPPTCREFEDDLGALRELHAQGTRDTLETEASERDLRLSIHVPEHPILKNLRSSTLSMASSIDPSSAHGEARMPTAQHLPDQWPSSLSRRTQQPTEADLCGAGLSRTQRLPRWKSDVSLVSSRQSAAPVPPWCVFQPTSNVRLALDVWCVLALAWDLLSVPVILAWDMRQDGELGRITSVFPWFGLLIWSADMVMNFRTGFYTKGLLEMRPRQIVKRYVQRWFLLDALLLATDFVTTVTAREHSLSTTGKLVRVIKVGRLVRYKTILDRMLLYQMKGHPTVLSMLSHIVCLLFAIVWMNHTFACIWFAIGNMEVSDTGASWLDEHVRVNGPSYREAGFVYQYLTALHWSMTQMTPGSMQVQPLNSVERAFNVACLIFGLIVFTTIVSMLSSKMTQLRMLKNDWREQRRQLAKFLRERGVSAHLSVRIRQQVEDRLSQVRPLNLVEVSALQKVSIPLLDELKIELCRDHLLCHPFFATVSLLDRSVVDALACVCSTLTFLMPEDTLFWPGQLAEKMHYVIKGHMRYLQEVVWNRSGEKLKSNVSEGTWLCEAALWTHWLHVGRMEAITAAELLTLDVEKVISCFEGVASVKITARSYGDVYHRMVTNVTEAWPNDVTVPDASHELIIMKMNHSARVRVGCVALEKLRRLRRCQNDPELETKMLNGQLSLFVTGSGEIQRFVSVVAVSCRREDGRVLVSLGVLQGRELKARCRLPGSKHLPSEEPHEAVQRLLNTKLSPLQPFMEAGETQHTCEWRDSSVYRIMTRYDKFVWHATVSVEFDKSQDIVKLRGKFKSALRGPPLPDVWGIRCGDEMNIYAWMQQESFDYFSSPAGDVALPNRLLGIEETDTHFLCV